MKKLLSILLVFVMLLSLAACSGTHTVSADPTEAPVTEAPEEPTAEPTEAPTGEPTAAPTEEPSPDEGEFAFWPTDIDHDGYSDRIFLDLSALDENGFATPYVELYDGTKLELPCPVSTSHAGMGTYASMLIDGLSYILYYRPSWYDGLCEDYYCVLYAEGGALKVYAENSIEYEVSSVRPLPPVDEDAVLGFIDEVNALWNSQCSVLFSTDTDIALRQIYDARTDAPLELRCEKPFVYSIFAEQYGNGAFETPDLEGWYYCRETLARFDAEFGGIEGYSAAFTPAEKLSFANRCMEMNSGSK